jgi:putative transposase
MPDKTSSKPKRLKPKRLKPKRRKPRPLWKAPQLDLTFRTHGGARKHAGRKPRGRRAGIRHRPRACCGPHRPVHCSLSLASDIPNLRHPELFSVVRAAVYRGAERPGFRVVHFSVQKRHMHLIVEADSAQLLGRGMQALSIRLARQINRALGRTGTVFVDRYFSRVLRTPGETRAAINYVLQNARRHERQRGKARNPFNLDYCSSAKRFTGWKEIRIELSADDLPIGRPRCWLLREGWMGQGEGRRLLSVHEVPARW